MKWQVGVCGLIIAIPAAVSLSLINNKRRKGELSFNCNHVHHQQLWVPCWTNLNPNWLLVFRAFAFLSMDWLLYQMLLFAGLFAFYFYTQWTFALVMVYFAIGTFISARGCFMSSEKSQTDSHETEKFLKNGLQESKPTATSKARTKERQRKKFRKDSTDDEATQRAGFLGPLMLIVYQTSAGASMLTDLVFWCLLMPMLAGKEFELTFVIGCIHSVNAIFLIIDSALNSLPFEWFGFTYFILWSAIYVTFQWILHACGFAWWPYPFLELATPWAPLWYLGLALIHVPLYGIYMLLVKAKNTLFSRLFPQAFVRSGETTRQRDKKAA